MSTEVILYSKSATKKHLCGHLISLGYRPSGHLWNWPKGSRNFHWFEAEDFKSIDGVEATIYPPSEDEQRKHGPVTWALHTRTRASASSFDKEYQNYTIRTARRTFGGHFYNDWHGKNRYTPLWDDKKTPAGRGIFQSYSWVLHNIRAIEHTIPESKLDLSGNSKIEDFLRRVDPVRVLYNALVPFAVAAIEHFFSQTFKILLRYDAKAQKRLAQQSRKIDIQDVLAVSRRETSVEDIVAAWYSFQNVRSIHNAFHDWFDIDLWKLLRRRKRIGRRLMILERRFNDLIQFRHGIVHRFELDSGLGREEALAMLETVKVIIVVFVDYLERERGIKIRDSVSKRRLPSDKNSRIAIETSSDSA